MTWTRRVKCQKCGHAYDVTFDKGENIVDYLKKHTCPKCSGKLDAELDENFM